MKILCVIDSLGSGGAQRQLVNLAIGFKKKGHDVNFLVYHDINFFNELLEEHSIHVTIINEKNYLRRLLKMRKFIRSGNYNSVLSFLEAPNLICELAGLPFRKWKLIVGERSADPKILKSIKLKVYRWFHFLADEIVANSKENIALINKVNPLISLKKCKVIYNMVDFEKWHSDINYTPFTNGKFNLIVVASHRYLKNLDGLVEAVNLLDYSEKNRLRIDWYGEQAHDDSKLKAELKINSYGLNDIFKFHNPILKIHERVKQANALGLFSFYEGFPNVVCEAMAASKPVISTSVSDISLFIKDEKLLSNPNDIETIHLSIKYVLELSEKQLLEKGKENYNIAIRFFNNDNIIESYLKILI